MKHVYSAANGSPDTRAIQAHYNSQILVVVKRREWLFVGEILSMYKL